MIRFLFVCVACLGITCRAPDKPNAAPVWNVAPRPLWDSYCDGSTKWTGQRVRVCLTPQNYETVSGQIYWHSRHNAEPPSIIFVLAVPAPKDNTKSVTLIGTVTGPVIDGLERAFMVRWYVRVEGCVVTSDKDR